MNILGPNARAPLHIGDSSIGQYPSGSWIAEFLIALLRDTFHRDHGLVPWLEEDNLPLKVELLY